jgi:hypothetical protein
MAVWLPIAAYGVGKLGLLASTKVRLLLFALFLAGAVVWIRRGDA